MSTTLTTVDNIPDTVITFAEAWAMLFTDSNKDWKSKDFFEDSWHYFEGFDLNLVCEDGLLTICAYASEVEENGWIWTKTDDFRVIARKGKGKR